MESEKQEGGRRRSDIDDILAASSTASAPMPSPRPRPRRLRSQSVSQLSREYSQTFSPPTTSLPPNRSNLNEYRYKYTSILSTQNRDGNQGNFDSLVSAYLDSNIPPPISPSIENIKDLQYRERKQQHQDETDTLDNPGSTTSSSSSLAPCVCNRVVYSPDSINCGICHNTIKALYEMRKERLLLMDKIDTINKEKEEEIDKTVRQVRENSKLLLRITELENGLDLQADENMELRKDMSILSEKLVREVELRAEAQAERDKVNEELADFSSKVMDEAQTMVSDERRKNFELEQEIERLKKELALVMTKNGKEIADDDGNDDG